MQLILKTTICFCCFVGCDQFIVTPMDCSLPGSSAHGISQARKLEWVAISYSGDLPDPGIEPASPAWLADSLPLSYEIVIITIILEMKKIRREASSKIPVFTSIIWGGAIGTQLTWLGALHHHYYTVSFKGAYSVHQRRQWHPTPVLLPGKSHGRRSLVGCSPWGR